MLQHPEVTGALCTKTKIVTDDPATLPPQDIVLVTVKAHALTAAAPAIGKLLKPDGVAVFLLNGIPWWFQHGYKGATGTLPLLDPEGALWREVKPERTLGCVVFSPNDMVEPGVIVHTGTKRWIIGEPDGSSSPRLKRVHDLLSEAGFETTASPRIRHDIWYKLWGNMTMNPVSAITGATGDRMLDDDLVRNFCSAAMVEAAAIGAKIGCVIDQDPEARHDLTRKLGAFKTSMLVDAERGKPIELDALVTSVHELGKRTGVPTPYIDALLGLTRLFAQTHKLLPA